MKQQFFRWCSALILAGILLQSISTILETVPVSAADLTIPTIPFLEPPTFNPNYLMSNEDFRSKRVFPTEESVQKYLEDVNSDLKDYKEAGKLASHWVFQMSRGNYSRTARANPQLNPGMILALIQKESGLLTIKKSNKNYATLLTQATGYACRDGEKCKGGKFASFRGQVMGATWQIEYGFNHAIDNISPAQKNKELALKIDSDNKFRKVIPANESSASFYSYTPHVYNGNYNLWLLMTAYDWGATANGTYDQDAIAKKNPNPPKIGVQSNAILTSQHIHTLTATQDNNTFEPDDELIANIDALADTAADAVAAGVLAATGGQPQITPQAAASSFNSGNIISDAALTTSEFASAAALQTWFEGKKMALADFKVDGQPASTFIYNAATSKGINPAFIITKIGVEGGGKGRLNLLKVPKGGDLVANGINDNALGYGCPKTCLKDADFKSQVLGAIEVAAQRFKQAEQLPYGQDANNNPSRLGKVGQSFKDLDGITVTPENKATLMLYKYTPYVGYTLAECTQKGISREKCYGGNRVFYDIIHTYGLMGAQGDADPAFDANSGQQSGTKGNGNDNSQGLAQIDQSVQTATANFADQSDGLKKALQTQQSLPTSLLGDCQVKFDPAKGASDQNKTNRNTLVKCIGTILRVIFVVSILILIIRIAATQLGYVASAGDSSLSSGGGGPVVSTRNAIRDGLIGLILVGGAILILEVFNTGFTGAFDALLSGK